MPNLKHPHKLLRHKYKTGAVTYFCTLPDCTFKSQPAFLIGKRSACNICGKEFLLTQYSIRLAKPHCENCHKSKDKISLHLEDGNFKVNLSLSERLKQLTSQQQEEEDI